MTSILGISAFYHDSAAAILIDGEIQKKRGIESSSHIYIYGAGIHNDNNNNNNNNRNK